MIPTDFVFHSGTILDLFFEEGNCISDRGAAINEITCNRCEELPAELIKEINIICDRIKVEFKDGELKVHYDSPLNTFVTDEIGRAKAVKSPQKAIIINSIGQAAIAISYFAEGYFKAKKESK